MEKDKLIDLPIKFTDLLKLPDKEIKKLKLVFNTDWTYNPAGQPEYIKKELGNEEKPINLLEIYGQGKIEKINFLTRLHDPKNKRFHNGELAFCFIPFGGNNWLLANVFEVLDDSKRLVSTNEDTMADYKKYLGRLVITWKNRETRNVRMKDIEKIKKLTVDTILELPYNKLSVKFPGYKNVSVRHFELKKKLGSPEWEHYLKARKGIYVITDCATGKLYIGSAYGNNGIYGRWTTYANSGYDKNELENGEFPNEKLQELVSKETIKYIEDNFQYTLLETFTDEISDEEIIQREQWWKRRLLTKDFGYNAN